MSTSRDSPAGLGLLHLRYLKQDQTIAGVEMTGYEATTSDLGRWHGNGHPLELADVRRSLALSDAWWSAVLESVGLGILFGDVTGKLLAVTKPMAKMLGYTQEEVLARGPAGITHPDDVSADLDLFMALMRGDRERYQLEKRYLRKDGSVMWGYLTVVLLRDPAGTPRYVVSMVEDITARKRADADRSAAEWRHEAIEVNDGIIQTLIVTKWALDAGNTALANESLAASVEAVRERIQSLFEDERAH